ncbi:MAG: LysR family transcriptional regulator [Maritimibacter sp.]
MTVEFPNLRHLRAFKEVAYARGVSAAAHKVHLSQPAVTQAISGLEKRLGLALLERRAEGMFTTLAGDVFLMRITRMFEHLAQGASAAARLARRDGKSQTDFHMRTTAAQLRALIAIRDAGNFSLAARSIGISQPSIHRAGRDLEKLAGFTLFAPSRRGIELTPAAESFARAVKLAQAELLQGFSELSELAGEDSTRIAIGSMPLSRTWILPEAMGQLLAESSGVQLRTVDSPYHELLRGLRYGDLDLLVGALRDPAPTEDVRQEALFDDQLAVVAGPNHPLAKARNISLATALAYPWIAPPKDTPGGSYLFGALGIEEMEETPVRVVTSSMVLVRGLLTRGAFLTILSPHQAAVEIEQGLMVRLDVDLPGSHRAIGITTREGWVPTPTQARFLDLLRGAAAAHYSQNQ